MPAYEIYGRTDKGPMRDVNEDHILLGRLIKNTGAAWLRLANDDDFLAAAGILCAVADGVGGAAAGSVASRLGLKALDSQFYSSEKPAKDPAAWIDAIRQGANRANRTILDLAAAKPGLAGMASTLSGVCIYSGGFIYFNAGDSRVYRFRNGFLKQLTQDDSITSLAIDAGLRLPDSVEGSRAITNALGSADFRLDAAKGPEMKEGDMLLICSDGLYGSTSTDNMEELMQSATSAETAANALIDAAIAAPAHDNVSLIILRLTE